MHPATQKYQRELKARTEKEARMFLTNTDLILILAERLGARMTLEVDQAFEVFAEWTMANQPDGRGDY
jgi:hypothetical protein